MCASVRGTEGTCTTVAGQICISSGHSNAHEFNEAITEIVNQPKFNGAVTKLGKFFYLAANFFSSNCPNVRRTSRSKSLQCHNNALIILPGCLHNTRFHATNPTCTLNAFATRSDASCHRSKRARMQLKILAVRQPYDHRVEKLRP